MTRDIIKRFTRSVLPPADVLTSVNQELLGNIKQGMFVTMFFGILNTKNGELHFASAGHNPLIHLPASSEKCRMIKTKGFPLGMMPTTVFADRIECGELNLSQGDWLIQYTDGVNEAQNSSGEEFGTGRFADYIEVNRTRNAEECVNIILQNHKRFVGDTPQYDDITLLAVKWQKKPTLQKNESVQETANAG
jgi:sigma-B regulation protein RsbU (phosphoserine phosphatase)